jgi:hypothetical protein
LTFSINVLRSGRGLAGLFATVVTFLLLIIGVYCSTNSGVKPNISYLPHSLYPPLLQRRGGGMKKRGALAPLIKNLPSPLRKGRGIKDEGLETTPDKKGMDFKGEND